LFSQTKRFEYYICSAIQYKDSYSGTNDHFPSWYLRQCRYIN